MTTPALVSAGSVASAVGNVTPSFGQATTAGNLLFAWAWSNNPSTATFPMSIDSTSEANGWTVAQSMGSQYGENWGCIWYKANCSASDTAPTIYDSGYSIYAAASEFSGCATSSPIEWGGNAQDANPCYEVAYDNYDGDLIVGLSYWNGANANPTISQTFYGSDGSELSSTVVQGNSGGAEAPFYMFSYAIGGARYGDANKLSASISEFENYVTSLIASFKAA